MVEAFNGLTGFCHVVDDVIIYDSDEDRHALNPEKCKFNQEEVTFAGFTLSQQGYKVDHSIVDAISQFPNPTNRTDLLSFFGLVNQLSSSTNVVAQVLTPLRPLLSTKNDVLWSPNHQQASNAIKDTLTSTPVLSYFDASKPTRLSTDASRHGLGFILQQNTAGTWNLIQAGSQFLTDTESRYTVIELEMFAVCWAVSKCKLFLTGLQHFTINTDHNLLILILNNHRLDELENPRLQQLKTQLMGYNFTAQWIKGSKNDAPDALSCHPVCDPQTTEILAELDIHDNPDMSMTETRAIKN